MKKNSTLFIYFYYDIPKEYMQENYYSDDNDYNFKILRNKLINSTWLQREITESYIEIDIKIYVMLYTVEAFFIIGR